MIFEPQFLGEETGTERMWFSDTAMDQGFKPRSIHSLEKSLHLEMKTIPMAI